MFFQRIGPFYLNDQIHICIIICGISFWILLVSGSSLTTFLLVFLVFGDLYLPSCFLCYSRYTFVNFSDLFKESALWLRGFSIFNFLDFYYFLLSACFRVSPPLLFLSSRSENFEIFSAINFPLGIALPVSHRFWYIVLLFLLKILQNYYLFEK